MLTRFISLVYDRPWAFLVLWLALITLSSLMISTNLKVDVSLEQLQKPSSTSYLSFKKNTATFGTDESLMLLINSQTLLEHDTLKTISELHQAIASDVPHVASIHSIINIPLIQRDKTSILVSTAFDPWPENQSELNSRLAMIGSNSPGAEAIRALISADRKSTLMIITLQQATENQQNPINPSKAKYYREASDALETLISNKKYQELNIRVTGQAKLLAQVHEVLLTDIYILPAAALGISILALLILFRRLSSIVFPGLVILLPITSTLGFMSLVGSPVQIPTGMLPPSLVVVSVAFCVHILTTFYGLYEPSKLLSERESRRVALLKTFESKSKSLSMSMLSTVMALLTFGLSDLTPVANIGLFGAFGVWMAYVSVLVLTPIYFRFITVSVRHSSQQQVGGIFEKPISKLLELTSNIAIKTPRLISSVTMVLVLVAFILASKIEFSHKPSEWLPQKWPAYQTSQEINRQFSSMISIEILIDSGISKGVYTREFIDYLGKIQRQIDALPYSLLPAGMSFSLYSYLSQVQSMLSGKEGAGEIKANKQSAPDLSRHYSIMRLVAPNILKQLSGPDGRYSRLIIRVPTLDGQAYLPGIEQIESIIESTQHPSYKASITGQASLIAATYTALLDSATLSYGLSLIIILIMMIIHMKSLRDGLIMMIPNLLPILVVLAVMKLVHIPLDFLNILVVTLSMGLVVDDTIHFSGHFKKSYELTADAAISVKHAIQETGRAMIITTLVLALGWHMLLLSQFEQLGLFGMLSSAIMLLGLIADLVIAPALMIFLYGKKSGTAQSNIDSQLH